VYGKKSLIDPLGEGGGDGTQRSSPAYAFDKPLGISVVDAGAGCGRRMRAQDAGAGCGRRMRAQDAGAGCGRS